MRGSQCYRHEAGGSTPASGKLDGIDPEKQRISRLCAAFAAADAWDDLKSAGGVSKGPLIANGYITAAALATLYQQRYWRFVSLPEEETNQCS